MQENLLITAVNTLAARTKSAREKLGWTQQTLASKAGVSQGTIGNIESGERKEPRNLLKIAAALGVSPQWLLYGTSSLPPPYPIPPNVGSALENAELGMDTVPSLTWEQIAMTFGRGLPHVFRVEVSDSAMEPRVKKGAWIQLSSSSKARPGDGVLLTDKTGGVHFREFRTSRPGQWIAHAENKAFEPMESQRDGLAVLAVLMAVEARWG